jgi:Fur family ferric uptake transcriptional regulator
MVKVVRPPNKALDPWLERCRAAGMRRTHLLSRVLTTLLKASKPMDIQTMLQHQQIAGYCDPASLYRLVKKLEAIGVVRKIGLHERRAHYIINDESRHQDYIVCVDCGQVTPLEMDCPVGPVETEVSQRTGFTRLYHELQFYGTCPRCSA